MPLTKQQAGLTLFNCSDRDKKYCVWRKRSERKHRQGWEKCTGGGGVIKKKYAGKTGGKPSFEFEKISAAGMMGSFSVKADLWIKGDCSTAQNVHIEFFADVTSLTGLLYLQHVESCCLLRQMLICLFKKKVLLRVDVWLHCLWTEWLLFLSLDQVHLPGKKVKLPQFTSGFTASCCTFMKLRVCKNRF